MNKTNRYFKRYGKKIDQIAASNFRVPEAEAIWPDEAKYGNWMDMFSKPEKKLPWYRGFIPTNNEINKGQG